MSVDSSFMVRFAPVVWTGSERLRTMLHRAQGRWRCPTQLAPYSAADPHGTRAHFSCDDCVSEHGALLTTIAEVYLKARSELRNEFGWAYRVAERKAADRIRELRASQGALAKVEPLRGRALRISEHCAALSAWHGELVVLMLKYVGYPDPLSARLWPLERWLEVKRRMKAVPEGLSHAEQLWGVEQDINAVLDIMDATGGNVRDEYGKPELWSHRYVLRPLGRRRRVDTISIENGDGRDDGPGALQLPDRQLSMEYAHLLAGEVSGLMERGVPEEIAVSGALLKFFGGAGYRVIVDAERMKAVTRMVRQYLELTQGN